MGYAIFFNLHISESLPVHVVGSECPAKTRLYPWLRAGDDSDYFHNTVEEIVEVRLICLWTTDSAIVMECDQG